MPKVVLYSTFDAEMCLSLDFDAKIESRKIANVVIEVTAAVAEILCNKSG